MSYLHRKAGYGCIGRAKAYLETKCGKVPYRILDARYYNMEDYDRDKVVKRWDALMDATRERLSVRKSTKQNSRTYYHYTISPNPKDQVEIDTLMELGDQFVSAVFGRGGVPGICGTAQVACIAHADGENHIPHLHLIINNVDLDTGRRLRFDRECAKKIWETTQEIANNLGLSGLTKRSSKTQTNKGHTQGAWLTKTERALIKNDRFSWKQDIRHKVQIARAITGDEQSFTDYMARLGVAVERQGNDYIYRHAKNEHRWRCTAYRLGKVYRRDNVLATLALTNLRMQVEQRTRARQTIEKYLAAARPIAKVEAGTSVKEVAELLRLVRERNLVCDRDFVREISRIEKMMRRSFKPEIKNKLEKDYERVGRCRELAQKIEWYSSDDTKRHIAQQQGTKKRKKKKSTRAMKGSHQSQTHKKEQKRYHKI